MATREAIYAALFGLVSSGDGMPGTITGAGGETLLYTSRRVKLWDDLPSQPALCQAEHTETVTQANRMPRIRTMKASWLIYHKAGSDPNAVPATTDNNLLDAIEALFPFDNPQSVQTLGGLVNRAWIDGQIFKDPGDIDGQALMIVPISILVP